MSVLKTECIESRFFNFNLFGKNIENGANMSRTYFLGFFFFENFKKLGKTLGSNKEHAQQYESRSKPHMNKPKTYDVGNHSLKNNQASHINNHQPIIMI